MKLTLYLFLFCLVLSFQGCQENSKTQVKSFHTVEIETLISDSLLNIRALEIKRQGSGDIYSVYYAGSNGIAGAFEFDPGSDVKFRESVRYTDFEIPQDSIKNLQFRSIAKSGSGLSVLSIDSPALLFKRDDSQSAFKLVYKESDEKAFYDSMDFWNDLEGIAMGDPTEDCLSILITRDGGNRWKKIPCEQLPETIDGEAAFAASDTNIAIVGDACWIATGGMVSRIWYSADKGNSWEVYETPVIQGEPTTGIYSVDFYNGKIGYGIGGDYTDPDSNSSNKVITVDGGKTWQLVPGGPGYRSCVQYVPGQQDRGLVAIGFKGIDYSSDGGFNWTHLSDEGFYTLRFMNDCMAIAAGRNRIAFLKFNE